MTILAINSSPAILSFDFFKSLLSSSSCKILIRNLSVTLAIITPIKSIRTATINLVANDHSRYQLNDKFTLWQKRLSNIDHESRENQQYKFNGNIVVYNGEIYNYK